MNPTTQWTPSLTDTPYDRVGGEAGVKAIVDRFYDLMDRDEPALARLHPCDGDGHVLPENRERFRLFFAGWLGGPQEYIERHGHPRLRMRHAGVTVDVAMRDAWVRCMTRALDEQSIDAPVRHYLIARLAGVADFLRNQPG